MQMYARYFQMAEDAKAKSWDKHTKLGAVVIDLSGKTLVTACNNVPDGIVVTDEMLERPMKYHFFEHAERGACYYAAKNGIKLGGAIMWMSCNPVPCEDCARGIINSGIKMVVGRDIANVASQKWDESCKFGLELLKKAEVAVVFMKEDGEYTIVGTPSEEYVAFIAKSKNDLFLGY